MKRLNESKTRLEGQIRETRQRGADQEVVTEAQYSRLLEHLRAQLEAISPEVKRRIAQALIQKIVVTKDGFELHYFAGADQITQGEAFASPSFSLNKKFSVLSSFKGLNGGSSENRTRTPVRIYDFESYASTNSAKEPGGQKT